MGMSVDDVMESEIPLLFISFPSAKDPEWVNHPGRENKATCAIVTLANWDWFKQWEGKQVKKRGDSYEEIKQRIGHQMIEQTCQLFPQLRDCIDFTDIGSPVTNTHYIAQPHGEIYGLDHSLERFDPLTVAKLRPQTDIPGLYLTGHPQWRIHWCTVRRFVECAGCARQGRHDRPDETQQETPTEGEGFVMCEY